MDLLVRGEVYVYIATWQDLLINMTHEESYSYAIFLHSHIWIR